MSEITTLKKILDRKNISMYRLAKNTGLGQATISEIVNNKRKAIKLDTAIKISNELDINIEILYRIIRME